MAYSFYGQIISTCMDMPYFVHPFSAEGYDELCHYEYLCLSFHVDLCFHFFKVYSQEWISET